jgi:hypothetical protein
MMDNVQIWDSYTEMQFIFLILRRLKAGTLGSIFFSLGNGVILKLGY